MTDPSDERLEAMDRVWDYVTFPSDDLLEAIARARDLVGWRRYDTEILRQPDNKFWQSWYALTIDATRRACAKMVEMTGDSHSHCSATAPRMLTFEEAIAIKWLERMAFESSLGLPLRTRAINLVLDLAKGGHDE